MRVLLAELCSFNRNLFQSQDRLVDKIMAAVILNVLLVLFPLILGGVENVAGSQENRVVLPQGVVEGLSATSRDGRIFHAFKGIPYGKIEKRFAVSKPAEKWSGILKAHDSGPGCVKSGLFNVIVTGKDLDCLTLDLYSPKLPSNSTPAPAPLLPVMVWIHGGGFVEGGSEEYGPQHFLDKDVVLVIINYRLGILGFLNAGVASASGNQGLKDQVLALQWVQSNIAHFSGDKDKVTIFGESAGSISVSLHTLSPMSKGLFHRAIMQSGPALIPFTYHGMDGPSLAKKVAREMDCPSSNMEYLVQCLERMDVKLFGPVMRFVDEFGFDESAIWMGPSYETYRDNDTEVFLSEDPYVLAQQGKFHRVPIIMGLVAFESYGPAVGVTRSPKLVKKVKAQWGRVAPNLLFLTHSAEDPAQATNAIREHFMQGHDINSTTIMEFENMMSERHWVHPFRILASFYSKHVPVYAYNFTQQPPIMTNVDPTFAHWMPELAEGQTRTLPTHGSELSYLFDLHSNFGKFYTEIGKESVDHDFSNSLVSTWVAFATTGKPTGRWEEWETYDKQKIMHIEDPPKLMAIPKSWEENEKFWNSLSIKEYGNKWSTE